MVWRLTPLRLVLLAACLSATIIGRPVHAADAASKPAAQAASPSTGNPTHQPNTKPAEDEAKLLIVPSGSPEELLDYIAKLRGTIKPEATDEYRAKIVHAAIEAAGRILTGKPNDKQAEMAFHTKLGGLSFLAQNGDQAAIAELKAFPAELEKSGRPALAHMARGILLQMKLQDAVRASAAELKTTLDEVRTFLGTKPQPSDIEVAMMATEVIEMRGDEKQAAALYREFGQLFSASDDRKVRALAAKMEGAARRLTLVGNKIELSGNYINGQPLRWDDYRNKVVLVMFWATWCGPCRAELPDVKEEYRLYHDTGFDVIGISLDTDRKALEGFVKEQEIPWRVLFSDDPQHGDFENPMAAYYGVMGIPTLFLVGKDGKVVSTEVRGKLHEELERLLGPPASAKGSDKGPGGNKKS